MNETISLVLLDAAGHASEATLEILPGSPVRVRLSTECAGDLDDAADDVFEALCRIRRKLESFGAVLLCAGARVDVFPSGMSRSMGLGRKAYANRLGQPARQEDLVDLFEPAEPGQVRTVDEQKEFHAQWIQSLRGR